MNDLISRQAAIEAIASRDETDGTVKVFTGREVNSILADLPAAQQWIPCSERLPEEEGVYFVTFNKSCLLENDLPVIDAIWRDGQWQYGVLESYEHRMPKLVIEPIEELKVIAWMPLPEPYKGEET